MIIRNLTKLSVLVAFAFISCKPVADKDSQVESYNTANRDVDLGVFIDDRPLTDSGELFPDGVFGWSKRRAKGFSGDRAIGRTRSSDGYNESLATKNLKGFFLKIKVKKTKIIDERPVSIHLNQGYYVGPSNCKTGNLIEINVFSQNSQSPIKRKFCEVASRGLNIYIAELSLTERSQALQDPDKNQSSSVSNSDEPSEIDQSISSGTQFALNKTAPKNSLDLTVKFQNAGSRGKGHNKESDTDKNTENNNSVEMTDKSTNQGQSGSSSSTQLSLTSNNLIKKLILTNLVVSGKNLSRETASPKGDSKVGSSGSQSKGVVKNKEFFGRMIEPVQNGNELRYRLVLSLLDGIVGEGQMHFFSTAGGLGGTQAIMNQAPFVNSPVKLTATFNDEACFCYTLRADSILIRFVGISDLSQPSSARYSKIDYIEASGVRWNLSQ